MTASKAVLTRGSVTQSAFLAAVPVLLAGEFLAIFDISVVNVILPTLRSAFHVGGQTVYLVVAGYGLSYGSLLVLGGQLGDNLGASAPEPHHPARPVPPRVH